MTASTTTAPTRFLDVSNQRYAYRRFGGQDASAQPLLCLQHFTGTLDNLDPAVIDQLAPQRPRASGLCTIAEDLLCTDRCEPIGRRGIYRQVTVAHRRSRP